MSVDAKKDSARGTTRVYLVVENRLTRDALARLLQRQANLLVVGQNSPGDTIVQGLLTADCDVLVLDSLGPARPTSLIEDLAQQQSKIKIILFGMEDNEECFLSAVRQGISGYLLKKASAAEIVSAVQSVARGEAVCPNELCRALFEYVSQDFRQRSGMSDQEACLKAGLTFRQRQLVSLVAKGMSNKEIAAQLNLSEYTVKNHMYRIMKQLEADTRQEAVDLIRSGSNWVRSWMSNRPDGPS